MMLLFGMAGLFMRRFGLPPGPAVLGLILGPLAGSNLRRALLSDGWSSIFTSPIAVVLLIIAVLAVTLPPLPQLVRRLKAANKGKNVPTLQP